jgi:2,4-dienoyl-CoA reductase-like NADH-dependent reductase (Old Yellow Enzyme family)
MASMTRNRCPGSLPDEHVAAHYAARAGAGLILSEGALIAPQGTEWPSAPGIWGTEHVTAWKKVTDAVHAAGGLIFCQLWHIGRVAHPLAQSGLPAPGPSAIAAAGGKFRQLAGEPGYVTPEAIADPSAYVALYGKAAANAKAAGFDGVELHGANGYLVAQFLESSSNKRTDKYGGSVANRCRFALEAIDAIVAAWGGDAKRVGIKLSPSGGASAVRAARFACLATAPHPAPRNRCRQPLSHAPRLLYARPNPPLAAPHRLQRHGRGRRGRGGAVRPSDQGAERQGHRLRPGFPLPEGL